MARRDEGGGGSQTRRLINQPGAYTPPKNINLNQRDYDIIMNGGRAPQTQGNQQIMTPAFNPMQTIQDFINPDRMHPPNGPGNAGIATPPQIPTGTNPVQAILAQLQKLMSGGGVNMPQFQPMQMPTFDPNRYKKEATQSVSAQYDPIIQQIMGMQKQTQGRAATNRAAVGDLYTGAVNDINAQSAVGQKQYDQAQAQSKQLYSDERDRIAAGYAADAASQRAEAKKLGTEALGMGTEASISQQNNDKQFADQMQSQQMLAQNNAFEQQQQGAAQYDRSIATATGQEGRNAQQDIMKQLEDYMSQSNSDLTNTRAQEAGSISDLAMKLAQSGYDRDAQNAQFQYQQQRDYMGDSQNLLKNQQDALLAQLDAAQKAQAGNQQQLNPYQQAGTFAEQIDPGHGSEIIAAIQKAMNERGEIYARPTDQPPLNPALFAKLIADYPENASLDRNALMQVAQILYKQLYGNG